MEVPIGTCSLCGGDVVTHTGPYHSIVPPVPHCTSCGAVKAAGPVIPMRPAQPSTVSTGNGIPSDLVSWRSNMPPPRQSFTSTSIRVREMLDRVPQSVINAIQIGQFKALAELGNA